MPLNHSMPYLANHRRLYKRVASHMLTSRLYDDELMLPKHMLELTLVMPYVAKDDNTNKIRNSFWLVQKFGYSRHVQHHLAAENSPTFGLDHGLLSIKSMRSCAALNPIQTGHLSNINKM